MSDHCMDAQSLIEELRTLGGKFAEVEHGYVWNVREEQYKWNDAKLQADYLTLLQECDTLFNNVNRFLKEHHQNHKRYASGKDGGPPWHAWSYKARCDMLIQWLQQTNMQEQNATGMTQANSYLISVHSH